MKKVVIFGAAGRLECGPGCNRKMYGRYDTGWNVRRKWKPGNYEL